jgi:predicted DsbA family dithiol-disulfide isomerase
MNETVRVPVELFFDYNCPFCYVASERLDRIARHYPLAIHYRFIETQPGNPAYGSMVDTADASADGNPTDGALRVLIEHDQLPLADQRRVTNSRYALLLAHTVMNQRPGSFPDFHRAVFRRHFADGAVIGDTDVLEAVAREHGVSDLLTMAWSSTEALQGLLADVESAQRRNLTSVPSLVVGERAFSGAVSVVTLETALAKQARTSDTDGAQSDAEPRHSD